jgi:hypothetical protein
VDPELQAWCKRSLRWGCTRLRTEIMLSQRQELLGDSARAPSHPCPSGDRAPTPHHTLPSMPITCHSMGPNRGRTIARRAPAQSLYGSCSVFMVFFFLPGDTNRNNIPPKSVMSHHGFPYLLLPAAVHHAYRVQACCTLARAQGHFQM